MQSSRSLLHVNSVPSESAGTGAEGGYEKHFLQSLMLSGYVDNELVRQKSDFFFPVLYSPDQKLNILFINTK